MAFEKHVKILLVGTLNAEVLAQQLRYYRMDVEVMLPPKFPSPLPLRRFDVIYGIYLLSITRSIPLIRFLRKKCLVHIIGSDAFRYANTRGIKKKLWSSSLRMCDEILYVTKELRQLIGLRKGKVIPIPIDTKMFKRAKVDVPKRDILYLCPDPKIYQLDWIVRYAKEHPDETITVLGCPRHIHLPNVKVVPYVPYREMPKLYSMHRRLIRMTTHDGYPKMPYEALLCGLEVTWNNQRITRVPPEMLMENTIPRLISIIREILNR